MLGSIRHQQVQYSLEAGVRQATIQSFTRILQQQVWVGLRDPKLHAGEEGLLQHSQRAAPEQLQPDEGPARLLPAARSRRQVAGAQGRPQRVAKQQHRQRLRVRLRYIVLTLKSVQRKTDER